jgi:hypothetical protein
MIFHCKPSILEIPHLWKPPHASQPVQKSTSLGWFADVRGCGKSDPGKPLRAASYVELQLVKR